MRNSLGHIIAQDIVLAQSQIGTAKEENTAIRAERSASIVVHQAVVVLGDREVWSVHVSKAANLEELGGFVKVSAEELGALGDVSLRVCADQGGHVDVCRGRA